MRWLAVLMPSVALAAPNAPLGVVDTPPQDAPGVAHTLFLNRCRGGCTITKGDDDASAHRSSLPAGTGPFAIDEFDWGDADWDALVQCMREVYSPYNVTITDVRPATSVAYNEAIVAGTPQQIGLQSIAGIAMLADDCSAYHDVLSFVFAGSAAAHDVTWLCYAVSQETGHTFGLDHAFEFANGTSACLDPMSYRTDCGGQRFFRPWPVRCGEFGPRPCRCGPTQDAHDHLLSVLGPGVPITAPPTVAIVSPQPDGTMQDQVTVTATAPRGVNRLELWLNGYLWSFGPAGPYGPSGQIETAYLVLPPDVPDGIIDIAVVAKDDLGAAATATVTATRGLPCTSADTCLTGQRCDAGRCLWDPPVGEVGDACTYAQYCKSSLCIDSVCSETCSLPDAPQCPDGFRCVYGYPDDVCRPGELPSTGCSASGGSASGAPVWLLLGLAIGFVWRRRSR